MAGKDIKLLFLFVVAEDAAYMQSEMNGRYYGKELPV